MPRRGLLIAFSGVDGSGKSTQIKLLQTRLREARVRVITIRCRWRPILSFPLLLLLRRAGYVDVHIGGGAFIANTRFPRTADRLKSFWCLMTQLDNLLKAAPKIITPLFLGVAVISDRYVLDMLVDGRAGLRDQPRQERLGFRLLRLLPETQKTFLMDIDAHIAFKRKPDLPKLSDYLERLELYLALGKSLGVEVIDARQSAEAIHSRVWTSMSGYIQGQ